MKASGRCHHHAHPPALGSGPEPGPWRQVPEPLSSHSTWWLSTVPKFSNLLGFPISAK